MQGQAILPPPPPLSRQPRVIVFASSAQEAVDYANPLRTALWAEHRLAVLLPTGVCAPGCVCGVCWGGGGAVCRGDDVMQREGGAGAVLCGVR